MPVTPEQAQQLASLAQAIRPHGARRWDAPGIVHAIGRVKHLHLADVAYAVINAAEDRDLDTPGAIGNTSSPCWSTRRRERVAPLDPYDPNRFCHVCGKSSHAGPTDHEFETEIERQRRMDRAPKPRLPRIREASTKEEA